MTRVHKCVPAGPDAIFHLGEVPFRSGPDQETLPLPARLALGAGAGQTRPHMGRGQKASRRRLPPGRRHTPHREGGTPRPLGGLGPCRCRTRADDQTSHPVRAGAPPRSPAPRGRLTPCRWKPSAPPAGCSALAPRPMAAARRRRACPVPRCPPRSATRRHQRTLALSALDCERLVTWVPASPTPDSDVLSNRPLPPFPGTRASNFRSREASRGP